MGGRGERITGTGRLMGWHREGVQLARTVNMTRTLGRPPHPGGSVSCEEEKSREVDGRGGRREALGSESPAQGAHRGGVGRLCSSAAQHGCCGAHPDHLSLPVLASMEHRNRSDQRRAGRGLRSMGGRGERVAGTGRSMGWHREGVQLARAAHVLWRSPGPPVLACPCPSEVRKWCRTTMGGIAAGGNVLSGGEWHPGLGL